MNTSRNTSWAEHDARTKPYVRLHLKLKIASFSLKIVLVIFFLFHGRAKAWEETLFALLGRGFGLWIVYFGSLIAFWDLVSFPINLLHYKIEKKYALSKQNFLSWFLDELKKWGLGGILGIIVLGVFYLSIKHFPSQWYFIAGSAMILFSILLAQLMPLVLIPIFFSLTPMPQSKLKERLLQLCEQLGVQVKEVYRLGLGEKTEKGNAAFVGIGKTKRIIIGDTLYERFSEDEVEAVFAHELGHQVHHDLWKGIFFSSGLMFGCLYLSFATVSNFGISEFSMPTSMFVFFTAFSIYQVPSSFLEAIFSRTFERAADRFAFNLGKGEHLANALERLTIQNWGLFQPNRMVEFFSYSHPAPWRRIMILKS